MEMRLMRGLGSAEVGVDERRLVEERKSLVALLPLRVKSKRFDRPRDVSS
jgi:hypothetical protein